MNCTALIIWSNNIELDSYTFILKNYNKKTCYNKNRLSVVKQFLTGVFYALMQNLVLCGILLPKEDIQIKTATSELCLFTWFFCNNIVILN